MMSTRRGPTMRAQWLGKQLRELRELARMTLKDAADHLQRDMGTMSRMETGLAPARASDVLALLDLYGVEDQTLRKGLEQLSRDIKRKGWWDGYDADAMGRMIDHAWIESRAEEIRSYNVMTVPGLLQTREYATNVIRSADPDAPLETTEHWVDFRMSRQRILTRAEPPRMAAILDEAVLRRIVGATDVMSAQLHKLAEISTHPAVAIQVLPFDAGAHPSIEGPFTIFNMPDPYPEVACVETLGGAIYVETPKVEVFLKAYDCLREAALSLKESAAFISVMAKQIEKMSQRSSR
ncbi:helix-turn-helix transcriptional regulator [Thermopolyspora sp. NPDC052614]|uniref:helix-turn-helix domain-containing protein n=1 Tax=Thermopolyspora sp. NPDC052614 TaxID=3155682 RepID=UPI0034160FEA